MQQLINTTAVLAGSIVLACAASAQAQDVISVSEWNQMEMTPGWSAEQLFDIPVRGSGGEQIGEVENIILDIEGNVKSVVLEVGGFLDIGDTHLAVPWDQVQVSGSGPIEYVSVPVAEDNYDQFDLSWSAGDVDTGAREFRATEMIGDYATLRGANDAGYLNDMIFDADGELQAVIVNRTGAMGGGHRAYPYYGYD